MGIAVIPLLTLACIGCNPPATTHAASVHAVGFPAVHGSWQPGGYDARIGSPYFYSLPARRESLATGSFHATDCRCGRPHVTRFRVSRPRISGHHHRIPTTHYGHSHYGWSGYHVVDPYTYHFGPGYYRAAEHGHFRFPYYSYRRPWYHPGPPVFNRDTNFAW